MNVYAYALLGTVLGSGNEMMWNESNDNSCLIRFMFQRLTYTLTIESLKLMEEETIHHEEATVWKPAEQL